MHRFELIHFFFLNFFLIFLIHFFNTFNKTNFIPNLFLQAFICKFLSY